MTWTGHGSVSQGSGGKGKEGIVIRLSGKETEVRIRRRKTDRSRVVYITVNKSTEVIVE